MPNYKRYHDMPPPAPATPPHTPPPTHDNVYTALTQLLTDHALADITLISTDRVRHPAVRALLASRSDYFRNLFFGHFQESRASEVQLAFSAPTIRNVLEYIYTDSTPPLRPPASEPHVSKRERLDPLVESRELAQLALAADYLAIPALSAAASQALHEMLEASPEVACTLVQLTPVTMALHTRARGVIRQHPREALGVIDNPAGDASHGAVRVLSNLRLAEVLGDRHIFASDSYLFKVLRFWASQRASDTRMSQAREMAKLVDLERCRPSFIRDFVRPSGLVDEERLTNTFEQQALEAERGRALFNNIRGGSVFSNGGNVVEAADDGFKNFTLGPWLTDGKHEWTFRVRAVSQCVWFGFASVKPVQGWAFFALEGTGWAFSIEGKTRPQNEYRRPRCPTVSEGETVKIVLNLTRTGSVTISTASTPLFTAFSGLRQQAKRFIPAVCISSPAKIELVEELHHLN